MTAEMVLQVSDDGSGIARAIRHAIPLAPAHKQELVAKFATVIRATVKGNLLVAASGVFDSTDEKAVNAALNAFVDGPFAQYMPLLAQEQQAQCPDLFCQRLAVQAANLRGQASPPDDHAKRDPVWQGRRTQS